MALPDVTEREVEIEEEAWVVRVEGWGTAGSTRAGAPLLMLTFARGEDPGERVAECYVPGRSLEDLTDARLATALGEARPYHSDWTRGPLFGSTRRGKGRRSR